VKRTLTCLSKKPVKWKTKTPVANGEASIPVGKLVVKKGRLMRKIHAWDRKKKKEREGKLSGIRTCRRAVSGD